MAIDDYDVTALVETSSDYSVLSSNLAKELGKFLMQWNGLQILQKKGAIINLLTSTTAFSIEQFNGRNNRGIGESHAVRVVNDNVVVPPRSSVNILVIGTWLRTVNGWWKAARIRF